MKVHWRVRIWVIEVRTKPELSHPRSHNRWSATGLDWYQSREQCLKAISEIAPVNFEQYEYRATKYMPAGAGEKGAGQ